MLCQSVRSEPVVKAFQAPVVFVSLFLEREVQEFRLEVRLLLISTALLGVHYLVLMTDTRERCPVNRRDPFGW